MSGLEPEFLSRVVIGRAGEGAMMAPREVAAANSVRDTHILPAMAIEVSAEEFEGYVQQALASIPDELADLIENCVVLVEDDAPAEEPDLLGLYDGVPLTDRGSWYGGVLPDRIFIYRNPTLRICDTVEDVIEEVHITVVHEIAHHFGIDDDRLYKLGYD